MTALGMALVGLGIVSVWAGVKGQDLRDVFAKPFGGKASHGSLKPRNPNEGVIGGVIEPPPGGWPAGPLKPGETAMGPDGQVHTG